MVDRAALVLRWVLAAIVIGAGVVHLVRPEVYEPIVPPSLPWPRFVVLASGALEIALGLGLAVERTRRASAYGLVAFFIVVFPANVHMAVNGAQLAGAPVPEWAAWARLPVQLVLILWASMFCRRRPGVADGPLGDEPAAA